MQIDRCICTQRTFEDLVDEARAEGWSLRVLVEQTGAGACCTMCGPYVRRAFRSGQTTFGCLLSDSDEQPIHGDDIRPACPRTPC
jgi:bacterioferritin-associated ferredoxin